jgi:hypothetical protein
MLKSIKMQFILYLLVVMSSLSVFDIQAMSIEEAYQAIPHRRTVFEGYNSKLNKMQIQSLQFMFDLTEQGIMIKVESLDSLFKNDTKQLASHLQEYRALVANISALKMPAELDSVKNMILQAIVLQQGYFENKLKTGQPYSQQEVISSKVLHDASLKLHQAFESLVRIYPSETAHNKAAFEDYLCALDFY